MAGDNSEALLELLLGQPALAQHHPALAKVEVNPAQKPRSVAAGTACHQLPCPPKRGKGALHVSKTLQHGTEVVKGKRMPGAQHKRRFKQRLGTKIVVIPKPLYCQAQQAVFHRNANIAAGGIYHKHGPLRLIAVRCSSRPLRPF